MNGEEGDSSVAALLRNDKMDCHFDDDRRRNLRDSSPDKSGFGMTGWEWRSGNKEQMTIGMAEWKNRFVMLQMEMEFRKLQLV